MWGMTLGDDRLDPVTSRAGVNVVEPSIQIKASTPGNRIPNYTP